jgi:hypothetical protein
VLKAVPYQVQKQSFCAALFSEGPQEALQPCRLASETQLSRVLFSRRAVTDQQLTLSICHDANMKSCKLICVRRVLLIQHMIWHQLLQPPCSCSCRLGSLCRIQRFGSLCASPSFRTGRASALLQCASTCSCRCTGAAMCLVGCKTPSPHNECLRQIDPTATS